MKEGYRMKKASIVFLSSLALCLALSATAQAANVVSSSQQLTVDGVEVACEKYNIDGSNYFKLRDLAYVLNGSGSSFQVGWDAEKQLVSITTGKDYTEAGGELGLGADKSASAQSSGQTVQVNGAARADLSVYNIGGNNFFKLRDLGEALGFEVGYDASTNTAVVTSEGTPARPDAQTVETWYKKGSAAYGAGNYGVAVFWLGKAAAQGNAAAQHDLGHMYHYGFGVAQSFAKAEQWYRKAAEQGLVYSQNSLGLFYQNGWGVPQDYAKAMEWYQKAADQGSAIAQSNIGAMYALGLGVPKDFTKAVSWYEKALEQNDPFANPNAYFNLAQCYENGRGVSQNYAKAAAYYKNAIDGSGVLDTNEVEVKSSYYLGMLYLDGKGVDKDKSTALSYIRTSAEGGFHKAQYQMGVFYETGNGVTKDQAESQRWYRLAAEQGNTAAQAKLKN